MGAVLATAISYWTLDYLYNPCLVYRHVFHLSPWRYYKIVALRVALALGIGYGAWMFWNQYMAAGAITGIMALIIRILLLGILVTLVTTALYVVCFKSFRHLFIRLKTIFKKKRSCL